MESILDPMIEFYQRECNAYEHIVELREQEIAELRAEIARYRSQYDALEEFANEQETRANALHDVIDVMIERQTYGEVRRDLIEAFNEVANDLGIDLELYEVIDLTSDSDEERDDVNV